MGLYLILIVVELVITRALKRFVVEVGILLGVFVLLNTTTGFPSSKQAFGGFSPVHAIVIMFICINLGVASRYFFFLKEKISWREFFKPMVGSPIVLLPIPGTLKGLSRFELIQLS